MTSIAELPAADRAACGERARAKVARDWSTQGATDKWLALMEDCAR